MRVGVLKVERLRLAGTVAVVALAALAAGCSGDVSRFDDGFYTGAVPTKPMPQGTVGAAQPYPGSIDQTRTGSVDYGYGNMPTSTSSRQPVGGYADASASRSNGVAREGSIQRTMLAPPSAAPQQMARDVQSYAPPAAQVEPVRTAASASPPSGSTMKAGWNNTGNVVTLKPGETIETLSNRYGVPVKALMTANGLTSSSQASAGQQIAIPTYSYGDRAGAKPTLASAEPRTLGTPPQALRASPTMAKAPSATGTTVTVAAGDSLLGIARRKGVSAAQIREANNMSSDTVRIGQKLVLPDGARESRRVASLDPKEGMEPASVVKPAAKAVAAAEEKQPKPYKAPQSVAAKEPAKPTGEKPVDAAPAKAEAAAPAAPATTIADESEKDTADAAPAGTGIDQFRWPVQGRVIKRYGEKDGARRNDGLDISVPRGTPVKAAENGVVIYAGDGLKEFGNTVLVRHDNGLVTVYGHADDLKVKRGEQVRRGQEIATAGMSGDAATPMVHFEVRKNSAPVDPGKFLQ